MVAGELLKNCHMIEKFLQQKFNFTFLSNILIAILKNVNIKLLYLKWNILLNTKY